MKLEQVSEHVWSLKTWILIPIRVWLVADSDGITLVDAGIPSMADPILKAIESLNRGPLQRILLTHGHSDHVGAIAKIRERHPVPVFAHRIEFPYMEGDLPYPRRKKAGMSVAKGLAQPLVAEGGAQLAKVASLRPHHTPGHSPGHVAYYHEQDRVLLAGDLFTSRRGELRPPMAIFTADMAEARRSSLILRELQPERLEVCHGGPVLKPAAQLDRYLKER